MKDLNLNVLVGEKILDKCAVLSRHAGMVDGKAVRKELLQLRVLYFIGLATVNNSLHVEQKKQTSVIRISRDAEPSPRYLAIELSSTAISRSICAVLAVSLRECTKTRTWFFPACSETYENVRSARKAQ